MGSVLAMYRRSIRPLWRRLISMRTALVLLFLLALAAVPGSLLPQRPLNPSKVDAYLASHGSWGRLLNSVGAFDVFGSFWFAAVYLLLFASLIGCLIPRIRVYAKALRAKPLKAPRNLSRLAEHGTLHTARPADEVSRAVTETLRPRWRTVTRISDADAGRAGSIAISAEKGYSREAGNLVFHVALLAALVLIAAGRLYSYQGSVVKTEGSGFCNNLLSYDSFRAGRWIDQGNLTNFCIDDLNSFTASYRADGSPAQFKADVTYSEGLNGAPKHDVITVNHPLRLLGDRVYLINHGFSPTVTIKRPGKAPITDTEPFLPADPAYTSEGVFVLNAVGADGKPADLGLQGLFAPTPQDNGFGVIRSVSPQVDKPVLALLAFTGDSQTSQGLPKSVYTLDTTRMTRVGAKNLAVGQTLTLPDGTTITFDGYRQWAALQVSHDPTQVALLIAAVLMVLGLLGSLAVRRRRIWLRITPAAVEAGSTEPGETRTLIEVGGLARSDSGNFTEEFHALLVTLSTALDADSAAAGPRSAAVGAGAGKD
jgi:cytochrome c biogenesis protein